MPAKAAQDNTAAIAATLAAQTASKAADLATTAATTATNLASKTAETTAVISNDITWMKQSLAGIELTLKEMTGSFVARNEFKDVVDNQQDHEDRIRGMEKNMWKWMGVISVVTSVLTIGISIILKVIK